MLKKNATIFRILLVAIAMVLFLLIMGGGVHADDLADDFFWDIQDTKLLFWNDKTGDIFSGTYDGIEWEAIVVEEDRILTETPGTAILILKNYNGSKKDIILPDYIKIKFHTLTNWHEYSYKIVQIVGDEDGFTGASNVTSILLGKYVEKVNDKYVEKVKDNEKEFNVDAFEGCTSLTEIKVHSENTKLISVDGVLYNKDKTKLIKVPAGKNIKTFSIPSSVKEIGPYAFSGNKTLEHIEIPSKVTKIETGTFKDCTNLKEVCIQGNVTSIGDQAFSGDEKLQVINLSSSLETIGERAFHKCNSLRSIEMPEKVNSIGVECFRECENLEKVKLSGMIDEIPNLAFFGCTLLKEIDFSNTSKLKTIGFGSFAGTNLTKVEIPESVTTIKSYAFGSCKSLECVVLPSGLSSLTVDEGFGENNARTFFSGNENLVVYCKNASQLSNQTTKPAYITYTIDGESALLDEFVDSTNAVKKISLLNKIYGKNVTRLGNDMFSYNTKITNVGIPSTITTIGEECFAGCTALEEAVISKNVTKIGDNAFNGCTNATICVNKNLDLTESNLGTGAFTGVEKIYYYGNGTSVIILTLDVTPDVDSTAPAARISLDLSEDKSYATINVTEITDSGSGLYKIAVTTKNDINNLTCEDWEDFSGTKYSYEVYENGTYYIYLMDKVGNITTKNSYISTVDVTKPTIVVNELTNGSSIVTANVSDEGYGSGLNSYVFTLISDVSKILTSDWKEISGYNYTISEVATSIGNWYIYVKDNAGNIIQSEAISVTTDNIDNDLPVAEVIKQYSEDKTGKCIYETVDVKFTDAGSGVVKFAIDQNETTSKDTKWIEIEGGPKTEYTITNYILEKPGTYYIHVADVFENIDSSTSFQTRYSDFDDLIAPRIAFGDKTEDNKVKVIITDSYTGIASGADISYAWGTSSTEEPENFVPATLTYDNGSTEVSFDADGNSIEEQGNYYLWLKVTELKDVAGNEFAEENVVCVDSEGQPINFEFDNEKPSIEDEGITIADKLIRDNEKVIITITTTEEVTIDENVKPIISSDSEAKDCIIGEIQGEGTTWTIEVEGGKDSGEVKIYLPAGLFIDKSGNKSESISIEGLKVDNTLPTVDGNPGINKPSVNKNSKIEYTIKLNEKATLDEGKKAGITLIGDGIQIPIDSVILSEDGKTVTITATAEEGNGAVTLNLPEGLFIDEAGNVSTAKTITGVTIDNTAPTLEITGPDKAIINKEDTATFTIQASENVKVDDEINAIITAPEQNRLWIYDIKTESVSGEEFDTTWKVEVSNVQNDGEVELLIPEAMFIDEAGNATGTEYTKDGLTIDNTAPILSNPSISFGPIAMSTEGGKPITEAMFSVSVENDGEYSYIFTEKENIADVTGEWLTSSEAIINSNWVEENGTYYVFVKDKAGNCSREQFVVDQIVILIEDITFDEEEPEIAIGEEADLAVTITPSTATEKIEWSSRNEEVATVDENGKVTGISAGTATITAKVENKEVTCKVTIYDPTEITGIEITKEPTKVDYLVGEDIDLTGLEVKLVRRNGSKEVITSYDVSPYDNTKAGEQTITITYLGKTATFTVTFVEPVITAESISLSTESLELEKSESSILTASVLPEETTDKSISWSSDNEEVATVDSDGKITAVGEGTAVITATSNSDNTVKASCTIKVIKSETGFTSEVDYGIIVDNDVRYLTEINPETKISDLTKFVEEGYTITVKDSEDSLIEVDSYSQIIATGMKITLTRGTKTITYILVVTGDCTGDGKADIKDMIMINNYRLYGTEIVGVEYKLAADAKFDSIIDIKDMIAINNYRLYKTEF